MNTKRLIYLTLIVATLSIGVIIGSIVGAIALVVLSTLGGVIGTAIFEKRKGDGIAPPPPQNLG